MEGRQMSDAHRPCSVVRTGQSVPVLLPQGRTTKLRRSHSTPEVARSARLQECDRLRALAVRVQRARSRRLFCEATGKLSRFTIIHVHCFQIPSHKNGEYEYIIKIEGGRGKQIVEGWFRKTGAEKFRLLTSATKPQVETSFKDQDRKRME